jgi:hypothetical protein
MRPTPDASYGSGHFGRWTDDEFGLPAFEYTCNQTTDPKAATDIKPGILKPTEHVHQVENDRITALASNFGHVRVRQDEGNPKILNDFDPEASQFAGGIGYLTDGHETLSTYYDGSSAHFERIFGDRLLSQARCRQKLLGRPGDFRTFRRRPGAAVAGDGDQSPRCVGHSALGGVLGLPGLPTLLPRLH